MVTFKLEADTLPELEAKIEDYLNRWHPCGYGTQIGKPVQEDGKWVARGDRLASCD